MAKERYKITVISDERELSSKTFTLESKGLFKSKEFDKAIKTMLDKEPKATNLLIGLKD